MNTETKPLVNTEGFPDRTELLRLILEQEQHRVVDYSEAKEVGESLISFFETLALPKEAGHD